MNNDWLGLGYPNMDSNNEEDEGFAFTDDEPLINVNVDIPPIYLNVFPQGYAPIVAMALQEYLARIKSDMDKCSGNENNVKTLQQHYDKVYEVYEYFTEQPSEGEYVNGQPE